MLGNQVELWESMLAVAKLGAVIMPTTGALGPADLADRITRGGAQLRDRQRRRHRQVRRRRGRLHRASRSAGTVDGWHSYADAYDVTSAGPFTARTDVDDSMLIYFTSGTTSKPKLVEHSQVSYPVGHMSTMAWIGVRPGDVHLAISSPGWAKHAWSCFFAPWIAEATIFVYNYPRFDAAALLGADSPRRGEHVLRAADGVAHADPVRPRRRSPKGCGRSWARASRSTPTSSRGSSGRGG